LIEKIESQPKHLSISAKPKSLIQQQETLPIELIKTHYIVYFIDLLTSTH